MDEVRNPLAELSLVGGRLCLDFANTVGSRGGETRNDRLTGYAALTWWGVRAEVLTGEEAAGMRRAAEASPGEAEEVFRRALTLREAIYRVFSATGSGGAPAAADLEVLNGEWKRAAPRTRVVPGKEGGFAWGWDEVEALDRVLWPAARSAVELLTSPELLRVGECAGETCGWLYLDTSKNRSRRWCDMKDCGNRAKVRRHYHRHHTD